MISENELSRPVVSVVIPTYNRAQRLERALSSVFTQTYKPFECLVIDDGSSEETQRSYEQIWQRLDGRFVLRTKDSKERTVGPGWCRNEGIRLARGEFIAFCDDDDRWTREDHLSVAVHALSEYGADLFFANMQTSTQTAVLIKDWLSSTPSLYDSPITNEKDLFEVSLKGFQKFLRHRNLHADMMVIRKSLLVEIGMYTEQQMFGEDYDIQFRLADKAKKIICRSTVTADLDVSQHTSVSRDYNLEDRALFTILSCLRAEISVSHSNLRRVARGTRAWYLLDLAKLMLQHGRVSSARELALQALVLHPTLEALRLFAGTLLRPTGRLQRAPVTGRLPESILRRTSTWAARNRIGSASRASHLCTLSLTALSSIMSRLLVAAAAWFPCRRWSATADYTLASSLSARCNRTLPRRRRSA